MKKLKSTKIESSFIKFQTKKLNDTKSAKVRGGSGSFDMDVEDEGFEAI